MSVNSKHRQKIFSTIKKAVKKMVGKTYVYNEATNTALDYSELDGEEYIVTGYSMRDKKVTSIALLRLSDNETIDLPLHFFLKHYVERIRMIIPLNL
jgi:hypothetical protein